MKMHKAAQVLVLGLLFFGSVMAQVTVDVANESDLTTAINDANSDSMNAYILELTADIELTASLPLVTSEITIQPDPMVAPGVRIFRSSMGGTPNFRIFTIGANGTEKGNLTLIDLVLENGFVQGGTARGGCIEVRDNGALDANRTRVHAIRCTFRNNQVLGSGSSNAHGQGGAIYGGFDSFVLLDDCIFDNNKCQGSNTSFNNAGQGAGGALFFNRSGLGQSVAAFITGCTFENNTAQGGNSNTTEGEAVGGALCSYEAKITLSGSTFINNQAKGGSGGSMGGLARGGAIFIQDPEASANQTITNCRF
ncbi:MAG: hypothetical protein H6510_03475 [Acidobacteria bacterium]|nr:hypothetical protein [Acidobacteriota bacterium]